LVDLGYDTHPADYDRKPGRKAPDNVFTSTARLWALTPPGAGPPPAQLTYRAPDAAVPSDAVPVDHLDYDFGTGPVGQPVVFTWDPARHGWARVQKGTPHVDAAGVQIAPTNVIVQLVPYHDTPYVDLSNSPVPEADLVGRGEAEVFVDGHGRRATWSKPDDAAVTTYRDASGAPIPVDPGSTWIALVPVGAHFSATRPDGAPAR
jgi:hypothetical protein